MRRIFVLSIILQFSFIGYAQTKSAKLEKRINGYFIVDNNLTYKIDDKLLLAKLKPGKSLKNGIRCTNASPSGIIRISVPDNSDPGGYMSYLEQTGEDITSQVSTTCDFAMPLSKDKGTNEHVFLCRFHEWNWYPVREGEVRGDSVYFHDATIRQWYRMGLFHNEGVQTFGDTFTLLGGSVVQSTNNTGDSAVFNIDYSADLKNLSLTRKDTLCFWGGR